MAIHCCYQRVVASLLFFIVLFLHTFTETANSAEPPINTQTYHGQLQPGFLFRRLLGHLTKTKNNVILCSVSSTGAAQEHSADMQTSARLPEGPDSETKQILTPKPSPMSTETLIYSLFHSCEGSASTPYAIDFNNVRLVNVVRDHCKNTDLTTCLQTTQRVYSVLKEYSDSLKNDLKLACCKLQHCLKMDDPLAPCQMCFQQQDDFAKQKPADPRQIALLKALRNITCHSNQYHHIPCTDLNLLALNLLAGPSSAMEWSEAIDILSQCYPTYATDIMRLFQDMMVNMSASDIQMLHNLLNATLVSHVAMPMTHINQSVAWARMAAISDGSVTSQAIEVWHMTPRSIAGIAIVVALISASLLLGFWAIYQKVKSHFFPSNMVRYTQVYMQDDLDDDEEDEFDENDVYYR